MLICRQVATLQLLNKRIRWMKIKNTKNSTGVVLSRAQWSFLYFLWSFRNRLSIYIYTTHNLIIVYYSTYSSICTFRKVTKIIFQNLANYKYITCCYYFYAPRTMLHVVTIYITFLPQNNFTYVNMLCFLPTNKRKNLDICPTWKTSSESP